MKLTIDIPAETYKAISEWDEPKTKYAAEYMLYQFVKNGKRIEQTNCSDAISRSEAIRVASGYCHYTNIPDELAKLPSVTPKPCEDAISRQAALDCLTATKLKKFDFILQAREEIKNLPSVSTEKTGRWKRRIVDSGYNADWSCSCCGYKVKTDFVNFNYCPNCGARMGVEE